MDLKIQKRLAAEVLNCSTKRVLFDNSRLDEIKESITKEDMRKLVKSRGIIKKQKKGVSRFNARYKKMQKSKGRQKGHGSRKGKKGARLDPKRNWINKIRLQRAFLRALKEKSAVDAQTFRDLYRKSKGGFFRSKRHIRLYIEEKKLIKT